MQLGPNLAQLGLNMAPTWPNLVQLGPQLAQPGPSLAAQAPQLDDRGQLKSGEQGLDPEHKSSHVLKIDEPGQALDKPRSARVSSIQILQSKVKLVSHPTHATT